MFVLFVSTWDDASAQATPNTVNKWDDDVDNVDDDDEIFFLL